MLWFNTSKFYNSSQGGAHSAAVFRDGHGGGGGGGGGLCSLAPLK